MAWAGHLPATRAALEKALMRAASGERPTSLQDRVLAAICEFRAMTANDSLPTFLRVNTARKLSEARFALNEIGAMDVSLLLSRAIADLKRSSAARRRATVLLKLQRDLAAVGDYLDRIIAQYALAMQSRGTSARPAGDADR